MAEFVFFTSNSERLQVILEYPPGGTDQRVTEIFLTCLDPSWRLVTELFPGNADIPFVEETLAGANKKLSELPPGLKQQIIIDDTNPDEVLVTGFRFKADARREDTGGGYF